MQNGDIVSVHRSANYVGYATENRFIKAGKIRIVANKAKFYSRFAGTLELDVEAGDATPYKISDYCKPCRGEVPTYNKAQFEKFFFVA